MGPRLANWFNLQNTTVDALRQDHRKAYLMEDVAWHFSFLGDAENFKLKLASYEHTENNNASVTANAEEKIEKGLDPLGRGQMYQAVPIDDTYPEYILKNQEKYSNLIKPWK